MSRRAFTLIELMCALGVLALLALVLSAGLGQAKARARAALCRNHLKQWGLACHLYATDHNDWLPPEGSPNGLSRSGAWYTELPVVLGIPDYHSLEWRTNPLVPLPRLSLWVCSANTNRSNGLNLFHYVLNGRLDGTGARDQPVRLAAVPSPSTAVWLFENKGRAAVAQQNNTHTNLHNRGAHFTFLDGHVDGFRSEAYWDYQIDRGRTNSPGLVWDPLNLR